MTVISTLWMKKLRLRELKSFVNYTEQHFEQYLGHSKCSTNIYIYILWSQDIQQNIWFPLPVRVLKITVLYSYMPVISESWILKKAAIQRHKDEGLIWCYKGFPGESSGKESACSTGDLALIPWSGRSPGEGNGYPLQYCCLENPMNRGASGRQSMGSQRVVHNWATNTYTLIRCYKFYLYCHPHFIKIGG